VVVGTTTAQYPERVVPARRDLRDQGDREARKIRVLVA